MPLVLLPPGKACCAQPCTAAGYSVYCPGRYGGFKAGAVPFGTTATPVPPGTVKPVSFGNGVIFGLW